MFWSFSLFLLSLPVRWRDPAGPGIDPVRIRRRHLDQALAVSSASASWTLIGSVSSIAIGLLSGSLALVAFGAVGLFDCASDLVLVVHFWRQRRGEDAERLERIAERVCSIGLIVVGTRTGYAATRELVAHQPSTPSSSAVALSAASVLALAGLYVAKRRVAGRLESRGLRADAQLTGLGAMLAVVTLTGVAATTTLGWWQADPAAALAIAVAAIGLGISSLRPAVRA